MSDKTTYHTVRDGLNREIEIIWRGPGYYAQSADKRIVQVEADESSRHHGTAFWYNSPEEIKVKF